MKRGLKIGLALSVIIGYLIFAVTMFSYATESIVCTGIHVTVADSATLRFVNQKEVYSYLHTEKMNPQGIPYEQVDEHAIEAMLESKSRIKSAECYKTTSGILHIVVTQREPVLRVMNSGKSFYIDSEGGVMQVSDNFTAYVPVVTGAVTEEMAKKELFDFAIYLKKNKFWDAMIEQIDVNYRNEVTLVPRVGNHIIFLGTLDGFEGKLQKLYALYKNGFSKTGWNGYEKINLSFDNQVVCTKK